MYNMLQFIIKNLKMLWESWNIHGFIILSFCVQTFLVLFAPFRKRTSNRLLMFLIWAAYLLADWIAGFTVGLISTSLHSDERPKELLALWASIILLHFGGPNTISAFNLEDNKLWHRQLFGLAAQIIAAARIFSQTLPHKKLLLPTLLLSAAGIIKNFQRIKALRAASRKNNFFKDIKTTDQNVFDPTREGLLLHLPELDMVRYARFYHEYMKTLLVDIPFSVTVRDASRQFFLSQSPEDVLQLLAIEQNLIYETFFTKMVAVHGLGGLILLTASFTSVAVALAWLYFVAEKWAPEIFDCAMTYTLLLGSLILDSVALFMLFFSDWTVANLNVETMRKPNIKVRILDAFYYWKRIQWKSCTSLRGQNEVLATPLLFRRWSESIPGLNMVAMCLFEPPQSIQKPRRITGFFIEEVIRKPVDLFNSYLSKYCFHYLRNLFDKEENSNFSFLTIGNKVNSLKKVFHKWDRVVLRNMPCYRGTDCYISNDPLKKELWRFIFNELKGKHKDDIILPKKALEMCSARGELAIQNWRFSPEMSHVKNAVCNSITNVVFHESIFVWHLATDMCYYKDRDTDDNVAIQKEISLSDNDRREFSKDISDYMFYLSYKRENDVIKSLTVVHWGELIREFKVGMLSLTQDENNVESACKKLFDVKFGDNDSDNDSDNDCHNVLRDAIELARKLNSVENKWGLISQVWVEMLSYAAIHCEARAHIQQLSCGGELVGFVWLLMAHLGFINPSLLYHRDPDGVPCW